MLFYSVYRHHGGDSWGAKRRRATSRARQWRGSNSSLAPRLARHVSVMGWRRLEPRGGRLSGGRAGPSRLWPKWAMLSRAQARSFRAGI